MSQELRQVSGKTILIVIGIILLLGLIFGRAGNESSDQYDSVVQRTIVVNPATLRVVVSTTNTGDEAASANCDVEASDAGGSYSGSDSFDVGLIDPGESRLWNGVVTITNQGAGFVTDVEVNCD